ncbi:MAG: diadenylate cyclase CdaA [Anaerolineales bacterium]
MDILNTLLYNLTFLFQRLNWLSILDLLLVTLVFFFILSAMRDTQAVMVLRGVILLIVLLGLLNSQEFLPAFSWLVRTTLPALLLAVPVIFAPELRRALERLGRTGLSVSGARPAYGTLESVVLAAGRLSRLKHGALIVLQRNDDLVRYIKTGVHLDAEVSSELLLQIFYPNTPLHDGGVILQGDRVAAASCVMPLSTSDSLNAPTSHKMGLRHRAALGTSESSDAVVVIVSEETGTISIVYNGRMIRSLDIDRLRSILQTFYPEDVPPANVWEWLKRFLNSLFSPRDGRGEA